MSEEVPPAFNYIRVFDRDGNRFDSGDTQATASRTVEAVAWVEKLKFPDFHDTKDAVGVRLAGRHELDGCPHDLVSFSSPAAADDCARLVELHDLHKAWNGEAESTVDGAYRFYFDNTGGHEEMEMHILITYHEYAPGSAIPR